MRGVWGQGDEEATWRGGGAGGAAVCLSCHPARNLLFPLSRPCQPASRSSPPVHRHHHGNQQLTSYWWAGGEEEGEGRADDSPLLPPPHSEAQPSFVPTISFGELWNREGPLQSLELRLAGAETMRQAAHRPRPP